jgi:hypothetical protein
MRLAVTLILIFLINFFIQYFVMSLIMTNNFENMRNSLGKVYLSVIIGLLALGLEMMSHDHHYGVFSTKYYVIITGLLCVFIYLYRTQKYITDKEYLKGMIENHSISLLLSDELLKKTDNYHVSKISKNVIEQHTDRISEMKELLSKI